MGLLRQMLADSPVFLLALGESAGSTAKDVSGNGHDGTYSGATLAGASAVPGDLSPVFAAGSPTYVNLGTVAALHGISALTFEAWIIPTSRNGSPYIEMVMGVEDSVSNAGLLRLGYDGLSANTGKPEFALVTSATTPNAAEAKGSSVLNLNERHHMVGRYTGSRLQLIVDTVTAADIALTGTSQLNAELDIGRSPTQGRGWNGTLGFCAAYASALSDAAIARHYAVGLREAVVIG